MLLVMLLALLVSVMRTELLPSSLSNEDMELLPFPFSGLLKLAC